MNVKNLLLGFLLSATVTAGLRAQNHVVPDLSGTWKLSLDKSKVPKSYKVQSQTIVITCSGALIQMRYTTDGKESAHDYTADGKERTINRNQGGEVVVKAKWKGDVLVIETSARLKLPNDPLLNGTDVIHDKERWKLSSDGRSLTVEQDDPRVISVYDKLPL